MFLVSVAMVQPMEIAQFARRTIKKRIFTVVRANLVISRLFRINVLLVVGSDFTMIQITHVIV